MTDLKILISDSRKISAIQEEFNNRYPFLKLEFFSGKHAAGEPTARKLMKPVGKTIGECRRTHKRGHIQIDSEMTVAELERQFRELYGLNVQLFRKSGKLWLETSVTDGWTLEAQNNQGEALSKAIIYTTKKVPKAS
jgi:hypothetical protein